MTKSTLPVDQESKAILEIRAKARHLGHNLSESEADSLLKHLTDNIATEYIHGSSTVKPKGFMKNNA